MFKRSTIVLLLLVVGGAPSWAAERASATLQINVFVKPVLNVLPVVKVENDADVAFHLTPPAKVTVKHEERTLPPAEEQSKKPASVMRTVTYTVE